MNRLESYSGTLGSIISYKHILLYLGKMLKISRGGCTCFLGSVDQFPFFLGRVYMKLNQFGVGGLFEIHSDMGEGLLF